MTLAPGSCLGPYEIQSALGAGGMGEVYRARDTKLNRDVAIKILPAAFANDPDRLARFQREAQLLASLNHPNIAHIHGLEEGVGVRALVMELVDGEDLAQRLTRGAIPIDEALPIAKQIAEALEAAHEQGIVHRDLKPANIKVRDDGTVKVLDFGLAKAMDPVGSPLDPSQSPTITSPAMTQVGVILGTAAYMSPEQAKGRAADKRSDVWAFGVVLYEMLTGKRAFDGEDMVDVLGAVARLEPDWSRLPADVSPSLRTLLRNCLVKNRRERLGDIAGALFVLRNEAALTPVSPRFEPTISAPQRRSWKRALPIGTALLLGALLVTGALALRRSASQDQATITLSLLPPDGMTWEPDSLPSISPDGRYVASLATQTEKPGVGQDRIWIRDLGSGEARPLPGTEGALYLFWSPDSKSIAFFEPRELRRVDLLGGPPTRISTTRGRSGSWGKDVIVFQSGTTGVLSRVAPQGGESTPVTTLDRAKGEVAHSYPWFLPDGRHFLYTAFDATSNQGTVYLTEVGSNERLAVVTSAANAVFASPSSLVYLRDRTLMAQSLDVGSGSTTSAAYPIAERVGYVRTQTQGRFSISQNGILVFGGGEASGSGQLAWFDRQGNRIAAVGTPVNGMQFARISPNGNEILFERQDTQTGGFGIWLHDIQRGTTSRVTATTEWGRYPLWLPDGIHVIFGMITPQRGIAMREVRGDTHPRFIETSSNPVDGLRPVALSPKGDLLFVERIEPKTSSDVWVYPLSNDFSKGGDAYPYINGEAREQYPAVSPNNRWVAYASDESGRSEVYVQPLPKAAGKWQVSSSGGGYPVWSRDGRELYFIGGNGQVMATPVKEGTFFDAATPHALFDPHIVSNAWFDVDKNGRFLIPVQVEQTERAPITVIVNWPAALHQPSRSEVR